MWRDFYNLTKPGIIRGNLITAAAGGLLAARDHLDLWVFGSMLVGLGLVIASACVTNNYLDRELDARMQRTKDRALVRGAISPAGAIFFAAALLVVGAGALTAFTNAAATYLAIAGWLAYVGFYGYVKRKSAWGTIAGSISGALPPVIGYVALGGQDGVVAGLLFAILVIWQMPHFYAISLFRIKDYRAARLPVLPVVRGGRTTRYRILAYMIAFIVVAPLLSWRGITGVSYAAGVIAVGGWWLWRGYSGWRLSDAAWGKRVFTTSLVVLSLTCSLLALDVFLP